MYRFPTHVCINACLCYSEWVLAKLRLYMLASAVGGPCIRGTVGPPVTPYTRIKDGASKVTNAKRVGAIVMHLPRLYSTSALTHSHFLTLSISGVETAYRRILSIRNRSAADSCIGAKGEGHANSGDLKASMPNVNLPHSI